jgi:hypothetical protein
MYCTALLYCTALHTPLYFSASLLYCQCSLTHSIIPFSPSPLLHTYPHTVRAAAAASRERPRHVFAPAGVGTTGTDCSVLLLYFTLLYLAYALPIHHLYLTYTLPTPYLCSTSTAITSSGATAPFRPSRKGPDAAVRRRRK